MTTPKKPDAILQILQDRGYEAYYVGGCVRDLLLGRPVHDWDITTSALPEQVMACFSKCIPTGIRHGTVTVIEDGVQAEVTTFRTETGYSDGRHPDAVQFVSRLKEDLARRDFTINAMAMDQYGHITDCFDGQKDLARQIIRCVGDPAVRFQEDALRMFRALRFSAQLGFTVMPSTMEAIGALADRRSALSAERVREEVEKTLCSPRPQVLRQMLDLGLLKPFTGGSDAPLEHLAELPCDALVRWAALCRIWPDLDLVKLRLDRQTARIAMAASLLPIPDTRLGWKKLLAREGEKMTCVLAQVAGQKQQVDEILRSGECVSLRQLAVSGRDFPGLSGPELGKHLQKLLMYVLEHPEKNEKKILEKIS